MTKIKKHITLLLTVLVLVTGFSFRPAWSSDGDDTQEYLLKAAFLYRFTDYVDWGNTNTGDDFTIAVLGKSGITAPLIDIAHEKKAQGKRIVIKEYDDVNDIGSCQVVFISENYKSGIEKVVSDLGSQAYIISSRASRCLRKRGAYQFSYCR